MCIFKYADIDMFTYIYSYPGAQKESKIRKYI